MRAIWTSGVLVVGLGLAVSAQTAVPSPAQPERKLAVSFSGGNVTLVAQNVTIREILAEWSRQGGCTFEGADKLAGGTMPPMQFDNQPEVAVLDSLLRGAVGVIVSPRRAGMHGASQFEAVFIQATSHPTASYSYGSSMTSTVAAPVQAVGSPDDEIPPIMPVPTGGAPAQQPVNPNGATTAPMPGVYVPMQPGANPGVYLPSPTAPGARPGGGGTTPPPTTGRGGGSGGGGGGR